MLHDLAIVGAGPAGLALAIEAASRGLSTVVLERHALPCDKACGEGLMPAGARALEALGVRELLSDEDCQPFEGIRYVQEDGATAEARLMGGGLGVRRVALSRALAERARGVGAEVRERTTVRAEVREAPGFRLLFDAGEVRARVVVGADGLASRFRGARGLQAPAPGRRRYGMRRHYKLRPWSPFVEVHFGEGAEAYVTPVGRERVGVAFLWEHGGDKVSFEALLARFPALAARLSGAAADSAVMGAGPFQQRARAQVGDQFALLGDAAGYVDALTGEGLSIAFHCARVLGGLLPGALAAGAGRESLRPYERAFRGAFRRYAWVAQGMLALARRPALRRPVLRWMGRHPRVFERLVALATG